MSAEFYLGLPKRRLDEIVVCVLDGEEMQHLVHPDIALTMCGERAPANASAFDFSDESLAKWELPPCATCWSRLSWLSRRRIRVDEAVRWAVAESAKRTKERPRPTWDEAILSLERCHASMDESLALAWPDEEEL